MLARVGVHCAEVRQNALRHPLFALAPQGQAVRSHPRLHVVHHGEDLKMGGHEALKGRGRQGGREAAGVDDVGGDHAVLFGFRKRGEEGRGGGPPRGQTAAGFHKQGFVLVGRLEHVVVVDADDRPVVPEAVYEVGREHDFGNVRQEFGARVPEFAQKEFAQEFLRGDGGGAAQRRKKKAVGVKALVQGEVCGLFVEVDERGVHCDLHWGFVGKKQLSEVGRGVDAVDLGNAGEVREEGGYDDDVNVALEVGGHVVVGEVGVFGDERVFEAVAGIGVEQRRAVVAAEAGFFQGEGDGDAPAVEKVRVDEEGGGEGGAHEVLEFATVLVQVGEAAFAGVVKVGAVVGEALRERLVFRVGHGQGAEVGGSAVGLNLVRAAADLEVVKGVRRAGADVVAGGADKGALFGGHGREAVVEAEEVEQRGQVVHGTAAHDEFYGCGAQDFAEPRHFFFDDEDGLVVEQWVEGGEVQDFARWVGVGPAEQ